MVKNLYEALVVGQPAQQLAKTKRTHFAAKENVLDSTLDGACEVTSIFNSKGLFGHCETLLDSKRDVIMKFFLQWNVPDAGSSQEDHRLLQHSTIQNLCHAKLGVCPQLDYRPPQPVENGTLHSQHPPWPKWAKFPWNGKVHPVVAGTIVETVSGSEESGTRDKDVLIYYSFPDEPCHGTAYMDDQPKPDPKTAEVCRMPLSEDKGRLHKAFYHVYQEVSWLIRNSSTLFMGHFDARSNDLFTPYDGIDSPTVVLYPAHNKLRPSYYQNLRREELDVFDVLMFLWRSAGEATRALMLQVVDRLKVKDESRLFQYHTKDYFLAKRAQDLRDEELLVQTQTHDQLPEATPPKQDL